MNASKSSGQTSALKKQKAEKAAAKSKDKYLISSVLIKVSQGKTHAEVLEKLRKEVNPDASESRVISARATQEGRGSHQARGVVSPQVRDDELSGTT